MRAKGYKLVRQNRDGSVQEIARFKTLKEALERMDFLVDEWKVPANTLSVHPL